MYAGGAILLAALPNIAKFTPKSVRHFRRPLAQQAFFRQLEMRHRWNQPHRQRTAAPHPVHVCPQRQANQQGVGGLRQPHDRRRQAARVVLVAVARKLPVYAYAVAHTQQLFPSSLNCLSPD